MHGAVDGMSPGAVIVQVEDHGSLPAGRGLGIEIDALLRLDGAAARRTVLRAGARGDGAPDDTRLHSAPRTGGGAAVGGVERVLVWEAVEHCVVLPRRGAPAAWARVAVCAAHGVPLLRRESGGGAVVVGPGCLNIALVLSLDRRPRLADVEGSYTWLLGGLAAALAIDGTTVQSTDIALGGRKVAGHAQRRARGALLHHGVVLYNFDLDLIDLLLPEPPRRPPWRGDRTHREFLANAPLSRAEIMRRLQRLPAALGL